MTVNEEKFISNLITKRCPNYGLSKQMYDRLKRALIHFTSSGLFYHNSLDRSISKSRVTG